MNNTSNSPGRDTTIEAIHKTRERLSDDCKGDIHAISAAARKRQQESGRVTVSYAKEEGKAPVVPR
jgi:hypothetical protein